MEVTKIDHLVLTVRDIEETKSFYQRVLGMEAVVFGNGRVALKFGNQKLNLHELGNEFEPNAMHPVPGSADLCFITQVALSDVMSHVESCGVEIIQGPVSRTGACGTLSSFYFRDPSGNLIEVANEV
jgi:catechol 2,3-dioxygenase-like lactoylglutathione lyase family enzyme